MPIEALDELSRSIVVDVDNAVRTSANELVLAVEEFGEPQTEQFAAAVDGGPGDPQSRPSRCARNSTTMCPSRSASAATC